MKSWNYILEPQTLPGSRNMAVDDYLFSSLKEEPETFLRFYGWERPTASLGYSQPIKKVVDREYCQSHGIDIVRRITGGKLVLHHQELTYSICSSDTGLFSDNLAGSYELISGALITGLRLMGLEPRQAEAAPVNYVKGNLPCFSYPAKDEIEVQGKKIIGSAQKREGTKFLQHGSLPLEQDQKKLGRISFLAQQHEKIRMMALSAALGRKESFTWVAERLAEGFKSFFKIDLVPRTFTAAEKKEIDRIEQERHCAPAWINRT